MEEIGVHSRSVFIFAGLLLRSGAPSCFSLMPSRVACGVGRLSAPAPGCRPGGAALGVACAGLVSFWVIVACGWVRRLRGPLRRGVCCWGRALPSGGVRCGPVFFAGAGGWSRRGGLWGRGRRVGLVLRLRRLRLGAAAPRVASAACVAGVGSCRRVAFGVGRPSAPAPGGGPGGAASQVACAGLVSFWGGIACGWVWRLRVPGVSCGVRPAGRVVLVTLQRGCPLRWPSAPGLRFRG